MIAAIVEGGKGPAGALKAARVPTPKPGPGELPIRVKAAGVNRPDIIQRMGLYPRRPARPRSWASKSREKWPRLGGECNPVVGRRSGLRASGRGRLRGILPGRRPACKRIPKGLSLVQAAALPETAFTVFANVLESGALKPGETFVVHGATSGIGVMAIQMAQAAGARVIATSREAQKAAAAPELFADVSINSKAEDFAERIKAEGGADVILDSIAALSTPKNLACLKPLGRNVLIATQGGAKTEIDLMRVMRDRLILTGSTLRPRSADEKARLTAAVEARVWPSMRTRPRSSPLSPRPLPWRKLAQRTPTWKAEAMLGKVVLVA